ncbi:amidohydrolase family protein [Variovorax defluvii]|uniref:amidohydrolase family protein n=1 Tax=Variovorax defluvii TaxID=913761 RepID=UPI0031EDC600
MPEAIRRGVPPHFFIDEQWLGAQSEDVIEPELPIIDAHHHIWSRAAPYLVPELVGDLACGHNLRGTVYVEAGFAWREEGDPRFASVGEVEYANGVGALFASGHHGAVRACAGIVGRVDLTLGSFAGKVMRDCLARAPDRFRGVRHMVACDPDPAVSRLPKPPPPDLLLDKRFRAGFAELAPLGLSFDAYCYHPQLAQLIDLADAFPDTRIVVDHIGAPLGEGSYASRRDDVFRHWRADITALARRPNVLVKLGGLCGRIAGFPFIDRDTPPRSEELAAAWRPYLETCIEAFGAQRSMFESNFPPDKAGCSARVLWNAFKRVAAHCSATERAQLFAGTAQRAYRLPASLLPITSPRQQETTS